MPAKSALLESQLISDLTKEGRERATKRLITSALFSQDVMNEEKLVRELLPTPLSDLWGIPKDEIVPKLEESLQEVVGMIALETMEMGGQMDYETGVELIYEDPSEGKRFAVEVVRNLRAWEKSIRS